MSLRNTLHNLVQPSVWKRSTSQVHTRANREFNAAPRIVCMYTCECERLSREETAATFNENKISNLTDL